MRIVSIVLVLAFAACAKKQSAPPAATPAVEPAPEAEKSTDETEPGGGAQDETRGDPCDGGESKGN